MGYRDAPEIPVGLIKKIAAIVATVIVGLVVVFGSLYSVDAGHRGVVTRFGAVSRVTGPGAHFKLPLVEGVTEIGVRTRTLEWSHQGKEGDGRMESYSRDQQLAHISVKVVYNVKDDDKSVSKLYSQFRDANAYANAVVIPRALEAVKVVFGTYNAVRVIQERAAFIAEADLTFRKLVSNDADSPVIIEGLQIQDIQFSKAYEEAVEARMQAQVEVEKITQNLEREKKQAEIVRTKADADAYKVKAEGEAQAAAIRARSAALHDSPKLVELTIAEKWNGVLPSTMVPGSAVPFIGVK